MFEPSTFQGRAFKSYLTGFKHPGKVRVQNLAGNLFPHGIKMENKDGVAFQMDANDWITRIMLLHGEYEGSSTRLAKRLLEHGGVFIDIGANFGLFTCIAGRGNANLQVIAVEPNYKILPALVHNIKINNLERSVRIYNTAVAANFLFASMQQPASNNAGTNLTIPGEKGLVNILGCSLEFICKENNVNDIELIKIDIEGNEFNVFKEFPFDNINVRNIILEFNSLSTISLQDITHFFEAWGFKAFTISGDTLPADVNAIPENNIWFTKQ
jgi:FkbM family methyltransferase